MSNEVEVPELGAGGLARFAWRQLQVCAPL